MNKHPRAGDPGALRTESDLDRDPGIGESKGTTMSGVDPEEIAGENTSKGDVENDVRPDGSVDSNQRGRTNG